MTKKTTPKDSSGPFKLPEEMDFKGSTKPRSIRFSKDTEAYLAEEAKRVSVGFATLISKMADEYVAWLRSQRDGS